MCIHMDNFLYGVLQSIADYGIETWKISWASSNDSVRASSLETNDFSSRQDTLESCQETDARVTDKDEAEDSMA